MNFCHCLEMRTLLLFILLVVTDITQAVTYIDVGNTRLKVRRKGNITRGSIHWEWVDNEFNKKIMKKLKRFKKELSKCETNDKDMSINMGESNLNLNRYPFRDRKNIYGNCHSRFDIYHQGVRVEGKQVIYHKRNAGMAVHVPPNKGKWTQPMSSLQAFFPCVNAIRDPKKPQFNAKQLKRLKKCIAEGGPYWTPPGWKPKSNDFLTGIYVEEIKKDVGTFNQTEIQAKLPKAVKHIMKKLKRQGHTILDVDVDDVLNKELVIFVDHDDNNRGKLAFKIIIITEKNKTYSRPEFYIDVGSFKVLSRTEALYTLTYSQVGKGNGGNLRTGKKEYEKMFIGVLHGQEKCILENIFVRTINLGGSDNKMFTDEPHVFNCWENSEAMTNGAYSPLNDAHHYATRTIEMFENYIGPGKPNIPKPLMIKVHLNTWTGHFDGRYVVLGDGIDRNDTYYPAATAHIVAHEIGHVVTAYTSKLKYYKSGSGALNEAFSDWVAKALEHYLNGGKVKDWKIGTDVMKSGELRCLDKPTCDNKSIDHMNKLTKNMDVHHSSGIFNKAFYEMQRHFAYGPRDMLEILYNSQFFNTEHLTFEEGAEGVLRSAEDCLNGAKNYGCSVNINDVVNGFKTVGLYCSHSTGAWKCSR